MATKTAGTKANNNLTAIQWQAGGLSAADLATINELITAPGATLKNSCRIDNGFLFLPGFVAPQGIRLSAGDWICVDAVTGWPIYIPAAVMSNAGGAFTHS